MKQRWSYGEARVTCHSLRTRTTTVVDIAAHHRSIQMTHSEMRGTPKYLVPCLFMPSGDERQGMPCDAQGWIMPLSKGLVLNWRREESMQDNIYIRAYEERNFLLDFYLWQRRKVVLELRYLKGGNTPTTTRIPGEG